MHNNLPNKINISENIKLLSLSIGDAELVCRLYSDKENVQHMDEVIVNWRGDETRAKVTINSILKSTTDFVWVINFKDAKVGLVGLENIKWDDKYCELWYLLDPEFQGKGIMAEAVSGLIRNLTNRNLFSEIVATCNINNVPSVKLLKKSGFAEVGKQGSDRIRFVFSSNSAQ